VLLYLRHGVEYFFVTERILWPIAVAAEALVFFRLWRERLIRSYPFFTAFLAAEVILDLVLMLSNIRSSSYAVAYRNSELILTIFRMGVAAELYERICGHFPGIGFFRVVMASVFGLLAALVAIFSVQPNIAGQWAFPQTIVLVILRYQGEIFAGAFLLTWLFLRFVLIIRQPFRPNVFTHWTIATIYFGANGLSYLAILLSGGGDAVFPINCAMLVVQIACFAAWYKCMRRSGEELPAYQKLTPDQIQAVEIYDRELLKTVRSLPGEVSGRPAEGRDIPVHRGQIL
jgi:hypothetical protein